MLTPYAEMIVDGEQLRLIDDCGTLVQEGHFYVSTQWVGLGALTHKYSEQDSPLNLNNS